MTKKTPSQVALLIVLSVLVAGLLIAVPSRAADSGDILSKAEVKELLAKTGTAEEHRKLARHFAAKAAEHEADAKEHEALAVEYRKNPSASAIKHPMSGKTAEHCEYYAKHCRNAAKELRTIAAMHEELARKAAK